MLMYWRTNYDYEIIYYCRRKYKTYVMAVKLNETATKMEEEILKNSGWGDNEFRKDHNYVILIPINGGVCNANNIPENWDNSTFVFAHK